MDIVHYVAALVHLLTPYSNLTAADVDYFQDCSHPMSKCLYIYGAGGMAKVVFDTAVLAGWNVLGFIDDTPDAAKMFMNRPVLHNLPPPSTGNEFSVICAIGDCDVRLALGERLASAGYPLATIIHPDAVISQYAVISPGVYIAAGAVIDPGVTIGNFSIINIHSVVSHDTTVGCACHLAPATAVSGNCHIGEAVWLGLGTKVIEKISIGNRAFLGAGSVVINHISANTLAFGVPAKEVKQR